MKHANFVDAATKLSKNPLSIIALLLVFVYAIAGFVAATNAFKDVERIVLVAFMVIFPLIILIMLFILVTKHHDKLYAPSDFSEENNFVKLLELRITKFNEKVDKAGDDIISSLEQTQSKVKDLEQKLYLDTLIHRGKNNMLDQNYSAAIELFEHANKIEASAQCWAQIAYCQKRLSKLSEALDSINAAIDTTNEKDDKSTIGSLYWNRACYSALIKLPTTLVVSDLMLAIKFNNTLSKELLTDPDLSDVRTSKEFSSLIEVSGLNANV